ncbi:hypothetical protein LHK_02741 [Laribacter hongkongensis HLHK9]|uniref:Uncharacterized protein n=1 Tax=Laribacter hongkongensis (strain HLHK9) TaxID=557598 RepID=C1DD90_LARHH|nr:hypothetical protein LHK_02741 [Laribacter hongkongensis HLHK9]
MVAMQQTFFSRFRIRKSSKKKGLQRAMLALRLDVFAVVNEQQACLPTVAARLESRADALT